MVYSIFLLKTSQADVFLFVDDDSFFQAPNQLSPQPTSTTKVSFGQPNGLLARPPQPQRSHSSTSSPSRPKPAGLDPPTRQNSIALPAASMSHSDPGRKPTPQEIERDRRQTRIPSSKSPSPMKLPRNLTRMLSASPTKLPKETKALQDNITSLLGKRLPSENDPFVDAPAGKRARPQRKVCQVPCSGPLHAQNSRYYTAPITTTIRCAAL